MLLVIDSSAGTSLALVERTGALIRQAQLDDSMRHAEAIGWLLAELEIPVAELSGVVAGIGPGPFTGLRVGVAAARAFAWGAGLELLPLVSHDAAAMAAISAGESAPIIVTDARRREFFRTDYRVDEHGLPRRQHGPRIVTEHAGALTRFVRAADLGRVAALKLALGEDFDPPAAVYLRSPDVTMPGAPKRVTG